MTAYDGIIKQLIEKGDDNHVTLSKIIALECNSVCGRTEAGLIFFLFFVRTLPIAEALFIFWSRVLS